ncbi:ASCH domain-containing protein [Roseateles sp. DC23W]|uniref:ASCH domain-containing protein n=1 Tax=Pelomonas dachongensis TaxID=3299029 RepID=A0ABW7EKA8_9BURK
MPVPPHLKSFWNEFAQACGETDESRYYDICVFGDSEALADELALLVLRGVKRATAGSLWSYEDQGMRVPKPGDLSIVTDGSGHPLCVIETRSVATVPYDEVTAEFAAAEGEGDGSLAFWREAHRQYFQRECAKAGRQFHEHMLLACERFAVVYPSPPRAAPEN